MINIALRAHKMLIGHLWARHKCHFVYLHGKRGTTWIGKYILLELYVAL